MYLRVCISVLDGLVYTCMRRHCSKACASIGIYCMSMCTTRANRYQNSFNICRHSLHCVPVNVNRLWMKYACMCCLYRLSPTIKHKMFLVDNDKSHKFLHTMLAQTSIDPMQGFIDNPDTEIQSWWWMFYLEVGLHRSVLKNALDHACDTINESVYDNMLYYSKRNPIFEWDKIVYMEIWFLPKALTYMYNHNNIHWLSWNNKSLKVEIVLLKIFIMMRPQYHILY